MNQTTPDIKELYSAIRENDATRLAQLCSEMALSTFSDKRQSDHRLTEAIQRSAGIPVLQVLINFGVDPHAIPKKGGFSPLAKAVQLQRIDCLKYLLDLGVNPNLGLEDQRITLTAVGHSIPAPLQLEMLKLLVEHEVDINFQFTLFGDKQKLFTVLDHATQPEVKDYLRSVGAKTSAELAGQQPPTQVSLGNKHLDEVRAHFEKLFGAAEERSFRKIVTAAPGIAVHVIKPKSLQGFLTLFTMGLSAKPMKVPPELAEHAFAELYMQLPGDWDFQSSDPRYLARPIAAGFSRLSRRKRRLLCGPGNYHCQWRTGRAPRSQRQIRCLRLACRRRLPAVRWKDRASLLCDPGLRGRSGNGAAKHPGFLECTGCLRHESNPVIESAEFRQIVNAS